MKMKRLISLVSAVICLFMLSIPASALEYRASDQISMHGITVTPASNTLSVRFSVSGSGVMDKIGCESIYVYEKSGSRWTLAESWDEDDPGMSRYNSYSQINTILCDGEAGVDYKVVVTVFAENSDGRDTRSKTVYVTGK